MYFILANTNIVLDKKYQASYLKKAKEVESSSLRSFLFIVCVLQIQ